MLGVQSGWVFADPWVNYPTWYISVLLLCYIIFFAIVRFSKKKGFSAVYLFVVMVFIGCGIQSYGIQRPFLNVEAARGYYSFFTGVLLAIVLNQFEIRPATLLLSIFNVIIIPWMIVYKSGWLGDLKFLLTFVFYPSLIILFQTKVVKRIFSSSLWGTWGKISFDVFMWHNVLYLTMYIAMKVFHFSIDFMQVRFMYIYAIVCEVVGVLSYYFLEIPMQKILKLDFFFRKKA